MDARASAGWVLALISAASFATSGAFGTAVTDAGWSPGAAVAARVAIGGVILLVPAALSLRGQWRLLRSNLGLIIAYGLVAVAGCQLFYFNALRTLTVGVALLLEYLAIVMVVIWLWIAHHRRPRRLTVIGTVSSLVGLVLVLDLVGGSIAIDVLGVLWGLAAAVGLATYFILSSKATGSLPPIALAGAGMMVGAAALYLLGWVGALPMAVSSADVTLAGYHTPWWVPIAGLAVLAAAVAYTTGIGAVRRLGATLGSFVALTEVLFAVIFAWLLLGQLPALIQLLGGLFILVGVTLVRLDELRGARRAVPSPE